MDPSWGIWKGDILPTNLSHRYTYQPTYPSPSALPVDPSLRGHGFVSNFLLRDWSQIHTAQTSGYGSYNHPTQRSRTQRNRRISLTRWEVGWKLWESSNGRPLKTKDPMDFCRGFLNQQFQGTITVFEWSWTCRRQHVWRKPSKQRIYFRAHRAMYKQKCKYLRDSWHSWPLLYPVFLKYLLRFGVLGMFLGSKYLIT